MKTKELREKRELCFFFFLDFSKKKDKKKEKKRKKRRDLFFFRNYRALELPSIRKEKQTNAMNGVSSMTQSQPTRCLSFLQICLKKEISFLAFLEEKEKRKGIYGVTRKGKKRRRVGGGKRLKKERGSDRRK